MPQIREQIAMVHLPPSKTLKYLFHVRKTRRSKVCFASTYFLSAAENKPYARALAPPLS